tara:strand:+ start:515 stop:730 length:216 start_codon:yes stop_codon:yes gene_type:complete
MAEKTIIVENDLDPANGEPVIEQTFNSTQGDVQAGIEFIYHMREHLVDVGIATIYLFVCYGIYLTMKKYIK